MRNLTLVVSKLKTEEMSTLNQKIYKGVSLENVGKTIYRIISGNLNSTVAVVESDDTCMSLLVVKTESLYGFILPDCKALEIRTVEQLIKTVEEFKNQFDAKSN